MGQAIQYARKGSTIILVAVFAGPGNLDLAVLNDHELDLNTSMMYRNEDYVKGNPVGGEGSSSGASSPSILPFGYLEAYRYIDANRETTMKESLMFRNESGKLIGK